MTDRPRDKAVIPSEISCPAGASSSTSRLAVSAGVDVDWRLLSCSTPARKLSACYMFSEDGGGFVRQKHRRLPPAELS